MKKVCLAGFWSLQYAFGAAAILALYKGMDFLLLVLLPASYFSTLVGGKMVGIAEELVDKANGNVPEVVELLWKGIGAVVIVIFALTMAKVSTIAGVRIPMHSSAFGLAIFYAAAALRDLFLAKVYFTHDF